MDEGSLTASELGLPEEVVTDSVDSVDSVDSF